MVHYLKTVWIATFLLCVNGLKLPRSCEDGHYYEPSLLDCLPCSKNMSLVTSKDGFSCTCEDHSIAISIDRCKPCNMTEVVSSDGTMCVPRRCQSASGKIVCRKCPNDYISVTQNFDGSPMKEVQCIKCARGYKASNNVCVKCEACTCNKYEIIVKGKCIPKKYVMDRPKYAVNELHPDELLDIVKLEYMCTQHDIRACRTLSSICVRNFYTTDLAGPCRLWLQDNSTKYPGLPLLVIDDSKVIKQDLLLDLSRDTLKIAIAKHTSNGGFEFIEDTSRNGHNCLPPVHIKISDNTWQSCSRNLSLDKTEYRDIMEIYLYSPSNASFMPLPITILKPSGRYVQKSAWPSGKFRKFFIINSFLSTTENITNVIYLETLLFKVRLKRDASKIGSLQLRLEVEAQYATKSHLTNIITTNIKVEHDMPNAGVHRSLERPIVAQGHKRVAISWGRYSIPTGGNYIFNIFISLLSRINRIFRNYIWGGIFGLLMVLYALIQWRGVVRRGGLYIAIVPLSFNYIADALYYATVISTLHALAAEAGTLGLTLPLSKADEYAIQVLIYIVLALKVSNVLWVTWNQCRYDIFFLDWTKYNPPTDIFSQRKSNDWKLRILVREWMSMQTKRFVSPGFTATSTLLILYILDNSHLYTLKSQGYKWVITTATWWCSYAAFICLRFLLDKLFESSPKRLLKICTDLELSLIVFQEEHYAHYVDGRNEDLMGFRSNTNPLQTCRLICSPQLRTVYKKLANDGDYADYDRNHDLLSKFLGAFFERALDGLNWVASERTLLEKILNIELIEREGGKTSILLYDTDIIIPSCFAVTWLGEEWLFATFDAMLFGSVVIVTSQPLVAALLTLIMWQVMKSLRILLGNWNVTNKIGIEKLKN